MFFKRAWQPMRSAGDTGGAADAGTAGTETTAPAQQDAGEADTQITPTDEAQRRKAFDGLVRGEYRDLFHERIQGIIDQRFAKAKETETAMKELSPALQLLYREYGVDNPQTLAKAMQNDGRFSAREAARREPDAGQAREQEAAQPEAELMRHTIDAMKREREAQHVLERWAQESEKVKQQFPGFSFGREFSNPQFRSLLENGVDVGAAYMTLHRDEVMGGAMAYTAQKVREQTVQSIKARGMRPQENGTGGHAPATAKMDVSKLTPQERERIIWRVQRGEKIAFR